LKPDCDATFGEVLPDCVVEIYGWDVGSYSYYALSFSDTVGRFLGRGFWALSTKDTTVEVTVCDETGKWILDSLAPGWHIIGSVECPRLVDDIACGGDSLLFDDHIWGWDTTYFQTKDIVPYFGYWLLVYDTAASCTLRCGVDGTEEEIVTIRPSRTSWWIDLIRSSGSSEDTVLVEFGVDSNASEGFDIYYDKALCPENPGFNPDEEFRAWVINTEPFYTHLSRAVNSVQYWQTDWLLEVVNSSEAKLVSHLDSLPESYKLYLVSGDQKIYDLTETSSIELDGHQFCYVYLNTEYHTDYDSMWAEVDTAGNGLIRVVRRANTSEGLAGVYVCVDNGAEVECGYTDSKGAFKPEHVEYTYACDVYCTKSGYRPLKIQHVDSIYGNEVWCNDVELVGDAFVFEGDTLTILPGTNVRFYPNSDASSRSEDFRDALSEIVVYGGHIRALGLPDAPITFGGGPGGTGYEWFGIYVRSGGTADVEYSHFRDSESSVLAYNNPHHVIFKHNRVYKIGFYVDFGTDTTDDYAHVENCYLEHRIVMINTGDSTWAVACSVVAGYESCYNRTSRAPVLYRDNLFSGYTYRGVRNYTGGKARYINCDFKGKNMAAYVYSSELSFDSCRVDANNTTYAIYAPYSSAVVYSRWTTYDRYSYCLYTCAKANFGELGDPGHNCFLDDDGYAIYNYGNYTIEAQWNYFDTLLVYGSVECDSTDEVCHPDSSLRRAAAPGLTKPTTAYLSVGPAVPNPFNSAVNIPFSIPTDGEVRISIFDVMGHRVVTLLSGEVEAGSHFVSWDGRDASGTAAPSGVYFCKLEFSNQCVVERLVLMR